MTDFDPEKLGFDPLSKRRLVSKIIGLVNQIIDGYRAHEKRVSHWVQKDGIQNCWDARKDKTNRNKKWESEIALLGYGNKQIITITDSGTWGLTGKRLEEKDLEKDQDPSERWCRFENFAFENENVKDMHLLGSRGRGKFVFSAASESMTTVYETLRGDGVYRLGVRVVQRLDAPNWLAEGDKAKELLKNVTNGILKPLNHVGTRIIILSPKQEVVEDITDGSMERFISETWWEIIEKFGAKIFVNNNGKSTLVKPFTDTLPHSAMTPSQIKRPRTSKEQKFYIKESVTISSTTNKIKKLYILYDPDRTFDDRQRGISLQRDGMSIMHFQMTDLGTELSDHMAGFATFDTDFEKKLRKVEGTEHYSFVKDKIIKALEFTLAQHYRDFARKELGWKETKSAKSTKSDKKANDRARNQANKIAKKMGIGKGPKKTAKKKKTGIKRTPQPVQIQLNDLGFPDPDTERVNYGESIKKIGARVINNVSTDIIVGIKIEIRSVERDVQVYGKFIYTDANFSSKKGDVSGYCCDQTIKIEKADFTPGQYKVRASLALLTPFGKFRKGQELDTSQKSFFVQVDPPDGGIWEKFTPMDFSGFQNESDRTRRSFHRGGSRLGSYELCYNPEHAEHKKIKSSDQTGVAQYRYKLTIPELCVLDLEEEWGDIFTEEDRKDNVKQAMKFKDTCDKYTDTKYVDDV